jgi:hypothetical protein
MSAFIGIAYSSGLTAMLGAFFSGDGFGGRALRAFSPRGKQLRLLPFEGSQAIPRIRQRGVKYPDAVGVECDRNDGWVPQQLGHLLAGENGWGELGVDRLGRRRNGGRRGVDCRGDFGAKFHRGAPGNFAQRSARFSQRRAGEADRVGVHQFVLFELIEFDGQFLASIEHTRKGLVMVGTNYQQRTAIYTVKPCHIVLAVDPLVCVRGRFCYRFPAGIKDQRSVSPTCWTLSGSSRTDSSDLICSRNVLMKRVPPSVLQCPAIDPLYVKIMWDKLLATPPADISMLPEMSPLQQLIRHAELLDGLEEGVTDVAEDAPQLWAQCETVPVHWRVVYKGQATNQLERAKAFCCWALATYYINSANKLPIDTFGKGSHIASLKKATQAIFTATRMCTPIDDPDHTTPIQQACGGSMCTILFELVFFNVRSLPPLDVTDERLLNAAGILKNIATLTDTIVAANPPPQKPIITWAKTVHDWAVPTAAFVWAHHLNNTITQRMSCKKTAETLAEIHVRLPRAAPQCVIR